jgi:drug/metabolite transporter (DMT)-like permease
MSKKVEAGQQDPYIYQTYKNRAIWLGAAGFLIGAVGLILMAARHDYHLSAKFDQLGKSMAVVGGVMFVGGLIAYGVTHRMVKSADSDEMPAPLD